MMTLSPFEEMFRQSLANLRYDISTVSGILLEEPNFLYASRLSSDETTGSILYNPGYQPLADGVAGTVAGPKITAEFKPSPDSSVSVGDPLNEVSVTFKPKFKLEDPKSQDNKVIYPITGQDAAKVFTVKASGVKEDIILFSPDTDHASYTYEVVLSPGTELRAEDDGSLYVYGADSALLGDVSTSGEEDVQLLASARENAPKAQLLFTIPAPVVIEANKTTSAVKAWFEVDGDEVTLRAEGLAEASYPLSIDPSIYVETAQKLMRGNNETNTDFDVDNELIQKSQTTGARIDSWQTNLDISEGVWGHSTAAAGGYIYRSGGRTADNSALTPPIVESSVESLQSSNSSNFTMSMPGTRPAGDLYIAIMCHDGTGTVAPPSGGGWTEYADTSEHAAYYKIGQDQGGGDEQSSYTWTGSSEKWGGIIMRITNFDTGTPVSPTPTTNSGNSSTPTFPAITPSEDETLIIRAIGADNDEIDDSGWAPTGHTAIGQGGPTGTQDCAYAAASMDTPPAASVSTGTTNMQSGYVNDTYGSSTIAVNPNTSTGDPAETTDTVEWAQFDSSTLAIESPNPGTGACTDWCNETVYDLPDGRTAHSMVSYNGYLYVMGGLNDAGSPARVSTVYISKIGVNGEPSLWHPSDSNPENWEYWYEDTGLSSARSYLSAVAYNNRMYVVGGQTNASPNGTTSVEVADILPNGRLGTWTTTGMQALPSGAGTHMGDVVVYNDTLYTIGGFEGATTSSANLRNAVYYSKLNSDGTMNSWQTTENFTTARSNYGGKNSYIWGAYIYMGGGCSAVNGSGYCTTFASDMQLASINADGSLGTWRSIGNLDNTRIGYNFVGWQGGLYRLGGCVALDTGTGECTDALADVDYGVINPAGEVSTVNITDEIGEGNCTGGSPYNCDLPDLGDGAGQGGGMLSGSVILNGYLYVIGGCTNFGCSTSSGNVSYSSISSDGDLERPGTCSGTYSGAWCVDSTNRVNGTTGISAPGITVFNNRIYLVGGIDETADVITAINYNSVNDDGSLDGAWESTSFAAAGVSGEKAYTYAYARANPAAASTNPGNLYIIGGCSAISASAGCSSSYNTEVYKCNISTTGSINSCTTTGQLQLDTELATETNQGLGLHSGTVYANYIYLIGGYSDNVGDRDTVFYAKFDDSNNIVDVESGTANPADDDDDWILSGNTLSIGRRRGWAFGYNGHIYAVGGFNAGGAGIIPFIEWAREDVSDGSIDPFVTSSVTINQRWGLSMAVSNSYAYVIGGCDVGDSPGGCSSFEPSIQTFQLYNNDSGTPANYTPASNQFGTDRYGGSAVVNNGYIYMAGGCTDAVGDCSTATTSVQYAALDAEGDIGSWSATTAALPAARGWGKLLEAGGSIYWVGGQDGSGVEHDDVYYATPNTSTGNIASWGTVAGANDLPADRTQFGATSWNDRLYVVGGLDSGGSESNTVYISPDLSAGGNITSPWTTETTNVPDVARSGNTVVAYANNLYTFGGHDGSNYLLDSQFTQINSDGTIDAWTFTTPLPNATRQAEGFAANGYMYVVGGRSANNTCDSNTYVAPISANTTIATGNQPTGVGEWNETNERYTGDRYGNALAYNDGRLYILGGGCTVASAPTIHGTYTFDADNDSDESAWTWVSDNGSNGLNPADTARAWSHDTNDTASTDVGPTSGVGGSPDGYVYTEASSPAAGNDTFTTTLNSTLNASTLDWNVEFYWNQRGDDNLATVTVQTNEGGGGWVTRGTYGTGGPDVASGGTQQWNYENLDLSSVISNSSTQVRFRVTLGNSGNIWNNDFALDSITVTGSDPSPTFTLTGANRTLKTTLLSQPQVASYSRLIDTDTNVFPNSWLLNGLDNSIGARWQTSYRSAVDAPNVIEDEQYTGSNGVDMTNVNTTCDTVYDVDAGGTASATFSTAQSISSPSSANFSVSGGTSYAGCIHNTPETDVRYDRFYIRPAGYGALTSQVVFYTTFNTTAGYSSVGTLRFNTNGDIQIRDGGTTDDTLSALTANTWHRIEVGFDGGDMTVRLFRDGNLHGSVPDDESTITIDSATYNTFHEVRHGINTNPNGNTYNVYYDDYKSSSSGWVGSAVHEWGQVTDYGDVTLGDVAPYTPLDASGANTNFARWYFFNISIDASRTFGYPEDVNRGPTITDLSLFFTADPSKRLRHGKTFTGGEEQPLDTPCRQTVDSDCPLP